jgi:hypothetical protein
MSGKEVGGNQRLGLCIYLHLEMCTRDTDDVDFSQCMESETPSAEAPHVDSLRST